MKKIFLAAALAFSSLVYAHSPVDKKVEQLFKESFPNAEKITWYENDTFYEVLFTNNQVKCRLWYDAKGNVTKTERYYNEPELCPYMRAKLKSKYAGKSVFGVTEVTSDAGLTYYIILEDGKRWYHVSADAAGNLQLDKKMNKA